MRKVILTILLTAVLMLGIGVHASFGSLSERELQKLLPIARGEFNMSQNPRRYCVFMIFDQQDNIIPSFWCGHNLTGKAVFNAGIDVLTGGLNLNHSGAFTVKITNTANKFGMEKVIPGGEMVGSSPGKEHEFVFEIEKITGAVFKRTQKSGIVTGAGAGKDAQFIEFDVKVAGTAGFDGRNVPFEGKGTIGFNDSVAQFRIYVEFDLDIAKLGLKGGNGKPVKVQLYTRSSVSTKLPEEAGMKMDDLFDF